MDDLPIGLTHENRENVVVSSQRLEATDKEILTLYNERTRMISHLIKSPPASRKCDLLGRNRLIRELVFVSENKILVKLVNAQWVMLDPNGKVLPLPVELKIINEV